MGSKNYLTVFPKKWYLCMYLLCDTDVRLLREAWLKTVLVSVCGNFQHIWQNKIEKHFHDFSQTRES